MSPFDDTPQKTPGTGDAEGSGPSPLDDGASIPSQPKMEQATLFQQLGMDEPSPLEGILSEHSNSPNEDKQAYMAACRQVFMAELTKGPCTLSEARKRHGIRPPDGVDGRAAGVVPHELHAQGIIRPAGFSKTPWPHCHQAIAQRWELAEGGAA